MTRFENDHSTAHPLMADLAAGTYSWCQCGTTKTVPWCDGSHQGTGVEPLGFEITRPGEVAICNCGLTQSPPYCDGSHAAIE